MSSELSAEDKAMLKNVSLSGDSDGPAAKTKTGHATPEPPRKAKDKDSDESVSRGPHPAQYEGDGWGDTPVQMRS